MYHTHPFNGPLSGTTQVSQYQKGKTNLDFSEARDSEWQWNQELLKWYKKGNIACIISTVSCTSDSLPTPVQKTAIKKTTVISSTLARKIACHHFG